MRKRSFSLPDSDELFRMRVRKISYIGPIWRIIRQEVSDYMCREELERLFRAYKSEILKLFSRLGNRAISNFPRKLPYRSSKECRQIMKLLKQGNNTPERDRGSYYYNLLAVICWGNEQGAGLLDIIRSVSTFFYVPISSNGIESFPRAHFSYPFSIRVVIDVFRYGRYSHVHDTTVISRFQGTLMNLFSSVRLAWVTKPSHYELMASNDTLFVKAYWVF